MIIFYHAKTYQPGFSTVGIIKFFANGASTISKAFTLIWAD